MQSDIRIIDIETFMETKADLERLNRQLCANLTLGETMPHLGAQICASPVDHAVHDGFGHVTRRWR